MEQRNKQHKTKGLLLLGLLSMFILLWVVSNIVPDGKILWFLGAIIISILFVKKNKNIRKNDVLIGLLLGFLAGITNLLMGITAAFSYVGAKSVFIKSNNKIVMFYKINRKSVITSLLLTIIIGFILGEINILISSMEIRHNLDLHWVLVALNPGISEEVIFRFLFFAICVEVTGDKVLSKLEEFWVYLIIIVPHVLLHFELSNINIPSVIGMSLIFGLPFALLQRKRDLVSAMGSHYLVDLIRFFTFAA